MNHQVAGSSSPGERYKGVESDMKTSLRLMASTLLLLSTTLFAKGFDIPLIEGTVESSDNRHMTIVVGGLSYQAVKSTKVLLKGTGEITFTRIKTNMKARLLIANPPKTNKSGMPILSSIILTENPADN